MHLCPWALRTGGVDMPSPRVERISHFAECDLGVLCFAEVCCGVLWCVMLCCTGCGAAVVCWGVSVSPKQFQ